MARWMPGPRDLAFADERITNEEVNDFLKDWVKTCNTVSILAAGKTGVGKSTLLNSLSGEVFFKSSKDRSQAGTKTIESYSFLKNGVTITAWDSPGFQDSSGREEIYKKDLKKHCTDVDLLLYCISLKKTRADLGTDGSAFKHITEALTKDIWKRCVVVLTYSNSVERRLKTERVSNLKESFNEKVTQWKIKVQEAMREAGVDEAVIRKVLVVPAGHCKQRNLPGYENWLSNVWLACVTVTSEEAVIALAKLNEHRLKEAVEVTEDDFKKEGHEQPIIVPKTVVAGKAVGATGGAIIGALAFGIPTLGAAAPLGLLLGLAVGDVIGERVATEGLALVNKVKNKFKNWRKKKHCQKSVH